MTSKSDKKFIRQRFIEIVNDCIASGEAKSKSVIAKKIDKSPQIFTEIFGLRMFAGIEIIQDFCGAFDYNPDWILKGEGTKRKVKQPDKNQIASSELAELKLMIVGLSSQIKTIQTDLDSEIIHNREYRRATQEELKWLKTKLSAMPTTITSAEPVTVKKH